MCTCKWSGRGEAKIWKCKVLKKISNISNYQTTNSLIWNKLRSGLRRAVVASEMLRELDVFRSVGRVEQGRDANVYLGDIWSEFKT